MGTRGAAATAPGNERGNIKTKTLVDTQGRSRRLVFKGACLNWVTQIFYTQQWLLCHFSSLSFFIFFPSFSLSFSQTDFVMPRSVTGRNRRSSSGRKQATRSGILQPHCWFICVHTVRHLNGDASANRRSAVNGLFNELQKLQRQRRDLEQSWICWGFIYWGLIQQITDRVMRDVALLFLEQ